MNCHASCHARSSSGSSGRGPEKRRVLPAPSNPSFLTLRKRSARDTCTQPNDRQKRVRRNGITRVVWRAHANHRVRGITTNSPTRIETAVHVVTRPPAITSNHSPSRLATLSSVHFFGDEQVGHGWLFQTNVQWPKIFTSPAPAAAAGPPPKVRVALFMPSDALPFTVAPGPAPPNAAAPTNPPSMSQIEAQFGHTMLFPVTPALSPAPLLAPKPPPVQSRTPQLPSVSPTT